MSARNNECMVAQLYHNHKEEEEEEEEEEEDLQ